MIRYPLLALTFLFSSIAGMSEADKSAPLEVVQIEEQTWHTADDHAVAREIASPRNSRAEKLSIADIIIPAGVKVRPHYHEVIEEIYYVTAGSGLMHVAGKERRIGPGDAVVILPGERHFVHNDTDEELRLVVTCTPAWTPDCLIFD
ncbi:MAG: hypothetical protein SynsKO_26160 [Synoicihabitans sp.]